LSDWGSYYNQFFTFEGFPYMSYLIIWYLCGLLRFTTTLLFGIMLRQFQDLSKINLIRWHIHFVCVVKISVWNRSCLHFWVLLYRVGYLLRHLNQMILSNVRSGWLAGHASSSWLLVLFAGAPYNRDKKIESPYQLCNADCHWLKNVRCLGK